MTRFWTRGAAPGGEGGENNWSHFGVFTLSTLTGFAPVGRFFFAPPVETMGDAKMCDDNNRITLLGIIVEEPDSAEEINRLLHDYGEYIVGRMGIPYRSRKLAIISVVLDAPQDVTSSLSGKLGMLPGVSVKAVYSKR